MALSATDVWAVGATNSPSRALILHFDGRAWGAVPNACGSDLRGVSAVPGTNTLWAVGADAACFYDGATWTPTSVPDTPDLAGVSATSPTDVWAVGRQVSCDSMSCHFRSVILRWDGAGWNRVSHPLAQELLDVQVVAPGQVWAVGTDNLGTVIERWNGSAWSVVPSPDPEAGGRIDAVDAEGPMLWASGSFYDRGYHQRTLILQAPSTTQGQVVGSTNVGQSPVSWFGPTSGTTFTDVTGSYAIPGLPAGTYTLTVTYGFGSCQPATARVTVGANQTVTQNFRVTC